MLKGGPWANRVTFRGRLLEVGELRVLVDHAKKATTAKIPIKGGSKYRGRWRPSKTMFVHITAWDEQAEKLASMKVKDWVQVEGYFATQAWANAGGEGKTATFLHLMASKVDALIDVETLDGARFPNEDVPVGDDIDV